MEYLNSFNDLLQTNIFIRVSYIVFCALMIFLAGYYLDKRGRQKKGLSDNESIIV